jgi:hypothetical protein
VRKTLLVGTLVLAAAASGVALSRALAPKTSPAPSPVARGKYIVDAFGCTDCHTPLLMTERGPERDPARALSGHPDTIALPPAPALPPGPWTATISDTMTAWSGPWGTSFTANLTPDDETGLGRWDADAFVATFRTGKRMGRGRSILPPMPVEQIRNLSDDDLRAVFAYLKSLPPVKNRVPEPIPPAPRPAEPVARR